MKSSLSVPWACGYAKSARHTARPTHGQAILIRIHSTQPGHCRRTVFADHDTRHTARPISFEHEHTSHVHTTTRGNQRRAPDLLQERPPSSESQPPRTQSETRSERVAGAAVVRAPASDASWQLSSPYPQQRPQDMSKGKQPFGQSSGICRPAHR